MHVRWMTGFAVIGVALGLIVGPITASADTPLGHRGTVGRHQLRDTARAPGVECFYESTNPNSPTQADLEGLRVRPPVVFAVNTGPGTDRQDVGWQFIVLRSRNEGRWTEVLRTSIHFKPATDARSADFSTRGTSFLGDSASRYRVVVKTYWLGRSGTVTGNARNRVDFYKGGAFAGSSFCPGGIA
jgi:hypothetical protein